MSATNVPVIVTVRAGISHGATTTGDPTNGHTFQTNSGVTYIEVANTDSAAHTVTVSPAETVLSLALQDLVVSVPATTTFLIGPFPPGVFNQLDDSVQFAVSSALLLLRCIQIGV